MANQLPEYMKIYYTALLDVYEEIDREISKDGESYRIHFAKEAVKFFSFSFLYIQSLN